MIADLPLPNIEDIGVTKFAMAMPDCYKCEDPVESYRRYYAGHKYRFATWRGRDIPDWFEPMRK